MCAHVCCFMKDVSKSQWAWAPGFVCQDLFGQLRRAWGALGAGAVQRSAQHSFQPQLPAVPLALLSGGRKMLAIIGTFVSFCFLFPLSFSLFMDLKAKTDH